MAAIIQFSDGTYHGGGTAYTKPVKDANFAKTYISRAKALSVVKILNKDYWYTGGDFQKLLEGAIVWDVKYDFVKGHNYENL
ncbi:hypothetical protein EC55P1_00082 [Enterococcus phage EC55P1]|nr:hypothetical protein EC55P1_00082 [Enterococcus phage EC55P1]